MDKASPFLKGHSELPRAPTRDTPSKVKIRDEAGKCWSDKSCLRRGKSEFVLTSVVLLGVCVSQAGTPRSEGQAPPSLGFSRQEHWSGLPFPSPMHESEN